MNRFAVLFVLIAATFLSGCTTTQSVDSTYGSSNLNSGDLDVYFSNENKLSGYQNSNILFKYKFQNNAESAKEAGRTMIYWHNYDPAIVKINNPSMTNGYLIGANNNVIDTEENFFELNFEFPGDYNMKLNKCDYVNEQQDFALCVDAAQTDCSIGSVQYDRGNSGVSLSSFKYDIRESDGLRKLYLTFDFAKSADYSVINMPKGLNVNPIRFGSRDSACKEYETSRFDQNGVNFDLDMHGDDEDKTWDCPTNFYLFANEKGKRSVPITCSTILSENEKRISFRLSYNSFAIDSQDIKFSILPLR